MDQFYIASVEAEWLTVFCSEESEKRGINKVMWDYYYKSSDAVAHKVKSILVKNTKRAYPLFRTKYIINPENDIDPIKLERIPNETGKQTITRKEAEARVVHLITVNFDDWIKNYPEEYSACLEMDFIKRGLVENLRSPSEIREFIYFSPNLSLAVAQTLNFGSVRGDLRDIITNFSSAVVNQSLQEYEGALQKQEQLVPNELNLVFHAKDIDPDEPFRGLVDDTISILRLIKRYGNVWLSEFIETNYNNSKNKNRRVKLYLFSHNEGDIVHDKFYLRLKKNPFKTLSELDNTFKQDIDKEIPVYTKGYAVQTVITLQKKMVALKKTQLNSEALIEIYSLLDKISAFDQSTGIAILEIKTLLKDLKLDSARDKLRKLFDYVD